MGRPVESPWELRWPPAACLNKMSLFHGDRLVLRSLPPHTMIPVVEAAGLATSDLRHLLLWAAWLYTTTAALRYERENSLRRVLRFKSILRISPEQDLDFDLYWVGHPCADPVLRFSAVENLPTPPPEEIIDGTLDECRECMDDLVAFLASQ